MQKLSVADIMTPAPTTVTPDMTVAEAAEELELSGIRHLPVVDDSGALVGVVSARDLLAAARAPKRKLSAVMQSDVKSVAPDTAAHEAVYLMLHHAIGSVPVTDESGAVVGIVTDTDFLRIAYTLLGGAVPVDELEAEEREGENV